MKKEKQPEEAPFYYAELQRITEAIYKNMINSLLKKIDS